ncbi:MAG TPA: LLM class flavin-dependent oxidoreductase [Candidatus Limnocylindria bacterium]|nr:LLM class flavin-dependent oxidoreductase [Candidatus Limnocylindria bacterium]
MADLVRRVGLGLAARGDTDDVIRWSERARDAGLESVWFHDSYFERDAVTYATAVAARVDRVGIGLGALNPFTRHPVLIAMTVSSLDELAPERVRLALGSALPLRLAQMRIPYTPDDAVTKVSEAIDVCRALWRGERLPPAREGLPPLQPMFPPVHRVPIFVAGYRSPVMVLAGQKGDGYLARPAESVPGFRKLVGVMRKAARDAGRDPAAIETSGYLLTLVDKTRRAALDRAKREPFVIYMMSILSDITLRRAGFAPSLRDVVAQQWRAERFTEAAALIPDELVDAFLVCGTRDEVAARALEYQRAGMDVPLLQPIVQDDEQTDAVIDAAVAYGTASEAALVGRRRTGLSEQRLGAGERGWRWLKGAYEIARPFSFTASTVPVAAGGALAAVSGAFDPWLFLLALVGSVSLHVGTNVINEIYDVRKGVDTIASPRASHAIVTGRMSERGAFTIAFGAFALAVLVGIALTAVRGWPVVALGVVGLVGGYFYTAPPFEYKFKALGLPLVFLLMGVLMTVGSNYVISGAFDPRALVLSVPVGLLVAAILHGNEWRDITEDGRVVGNATLSSRAGRRVAYWLYVSLIVGAYMALAVAVALALVPAYTLLAVLSLPLLVRMIRAAELGVAGQQRAIAMIDLETAQLHAAFGILLVLGLVLTALAR